MDIEKKIIKISKYQLVESVETEVFLPTIPTFYDLGRREYLGIYPKFLNNKELFEYRWIYLWYNEFNTSITKGHISSHSSSLERISKTRNIENLGFEDRINLRFFYIFADKAYYKGDYGKEFFEQQLDLAIDNLKDITK